MLLSTVPRTHEARDSTAHPGHVFDVIVAIDIATHISTRKQDTVSSCLLEPCSDVIAGPQRNHRVHCAQGTGCRRHDAERTQLDAAGNPEHAVPSPPIRQGAKRNGEKQGAEALETLEPPNLGSKLGSTHFPFQGKPHSENLQEKNLFCENQPLPFDCCRAPVVMQGKLNEQQCDHTQDPHLR